MKKKIIWAVLAALFSFILYQVYVFSLAEEDNINPIYLIPKDAVFIIDTKRPIDTWDEVSASPIWKHLQTNTSIKKASKNIASFDQTFQDQKNIIDFIGERDLLISVHVYKPKKYGLLYVADLQKLSKLRFLKTAISKLAGDNFKVTKRVFKEHEIIELYNKKKRETLHISFIKNQLIASYTHVLVENSINQYTNPKIGRDVNFVEIKKETDDSGFFNVFIQHKYLDQFLNCFTKASDLTYYNNIKNTLYYSGFDLSLIEGSIIQAIGYTNVNEASQTYLKAIQKSGKGKRTVAKIAPKNTSLYFSVGFDSFDEFHNNVEELQKENPKQFEIYSNQSKAIEEKLDINLKKHIYSWIGDEIALLHFSSTLSKNKKDIAVVIKTDDIDDAKENLQHILSKIKENTPLKYKQINYQGYPINFFDLKGFFKMLAGNMFSKMEKPYFTIIDDYVVFSTSPNTLKSVINDNIIGYTLNTSDKFEEFNYHFEKKSSIYTYINTPLIYNELLDISDRKTRVELQNNKNYITCFSQMGLQLISDGGLFKTNITTSYQNPKTLPEELQKEIQLKKELLEKIKPQKDSVIELNTDTAFILPEIHPSDLSASEYKEFYNDKTLKFEVELDDGMLDGYFKMYYPNGKLKLKGQFKKGKQSGTWRAYNKETGKQIFKKRF